MYYDTTDNTTKLYSNSAWSDLGGGAEPGQLPIYTSAERDALSPSTGLMIYNTPGNYVQVYIGSAWKTLTLGAGTGAVCAIPDDCETGICYKDVDGDRYAPSSGTKTCQANSQLAGIDCDDTNASIYPGTSGGTLCTICNSNGTITYISVTFTYKSVSVTYGTVVSTGGKCWLDRNLGASQVATAYNDANAYGDLFQWGRLSDLHQNRTSGLTTGLSISDTPGHSNFIYGNTSPYDWRTSQNNNLWQGVSGINNPCPSGWRIPTYSEWDTERASWVQQDHLGAFASPLKLTSCGCRHWSAGTVYDWSAMYSRYWASTTYGLYASHLRTHSTLALMDSVNIARMWGMAVRCIKD